MSVHDLVFSVVSTGVTIYDPHTLISATTSTLRVTNLGSTDLSGLGMWIVPTTNLGNVDQPADFSPETDYQDMMTFGQATDLGLEAQGGLQLTLPQTLGGNVTSYVTRTQGSLKSNKLDFADITSGAFADFTLILETPPSVSARRLFIDLVLE